MKLISERFCHHLALKPLSITFTFIFKTGLNAIFLAYFLKKYSDVQIRFASFFFSDKRLIPVPLHDVTLRFATSLFCVRVACLALFNETLTT